MSNQLSFRAGSALEKQLNDWANANGMKTSAAIRFLISAKLEEIAGSPRSMAETAAAVREGKSEGYGRFMNKIQIKIQEILKEEQL